MSHRQRRVIWTAVIVAVVVAIGVLVATYDGSSVAGGGY